MNTRTTARRYCHWVLIWMILMGCLGTSSLSAQDSLPQQPLAAAAAAAPKAVPRAQPVALPQNDVSKTERLSYFPTQYQVESGKIERLFYTDNISMSRTTLLPCLWGSAKPPNAPLKNSNNPALHRCGSGCSLPPTTKTSARGNG